MVGFEQLAVLGVAWVVVYCVMMMKMMGCANVKRRMKRIVVRVVEWVCGLLVVGFFEGWWLR